jgi:hypothetical protein
LPGFTLEELLELDEDSDEDDEELEELRVELATELEEELREETEELELPSWTNRDPSTEVELDMARAGMTADAPSINVAAAVARAFMAKRRKEIRTHAQRRMWIH